MHSLFTGYDIITFLYLLVMSCIDHSLFIASQIYLACFSYKVVVISHVSDITPSHWLTVMEYINYSISMTSHLIGILWCHIFTIPCLWHHTIPLTDPDVIHWLFLSMITRHCDVLHWLFPAYEITWSHWLIHVNDITPPHWVAVMSYIDYSLYITTPSHGLAVMSSIDYSLSLTSYRLIPLAGCHVIY